MKKLIVFLCFVLFACVGYGQSKKEYCVITISNVGLSKERLVVDADFGDLKEAQSAGKENIIKDENGKKKEFYSLAQVLNYFGSQGWVLKVAFAATKTSGLGGQSQIYHYTFERDKQ